MALYLSEPATQTVNVVLTRTTICAEFVSQRLQPFQPTHDIDTVTNLPTDNGWPWHGNSLAKTSDCDQQVTRSLGWLLLHSNLEQVIYTYLPSSWEVNRH